MPTERLSVQHYREMIGQGSSSGKSSALAGLQALGRLKKGERNKTEAAYEAHLETLLRAGDVAWFRFNAIKLDLAEGLSLRPDFFVMQADGRLEVHDTKGSLAIFTDDAKAKMKMARSIYPFPFFVCFPRRVKDGGGWIVEQI